MSAPGTPAGTDLAGALDAMVLALAAASPRACAYLASCRQCRNHLLYLLDTEQFSAGDHGIFRRRLRALPDTHDASHGRADSPDSAVPQIRGATS